MIIYLQGREIVKSICIVFFFFIGGCTNIFCMEDSESFTLKSLPVLAWDIIIEQLISDIKLDSKSVEGDETKTKKLSLNCLYCIRRLIPLRTVCKDIRIVISNKVITYFLQAKEHIGKLGGPSSLLCSQVMGNKENYNKELARLCIMLDVDINGRCYTQENIVALRCKKQETMLTLAIFQKNYDAVERLLELGADPMQPNARYEIPIDLATTVCTENPLYIARLLKDNGGDTQSKYSYYGQDDVLRGGSYGTKYGKALLDKKIAETLPVNPFLDSNITNHVT